MNTMSIEKAKELLDSRNCSVAEAKEALEVVKQHLNGTDLLKYVELATAIIDKDAADALDKAHKKDEYKDVSEEVINNNAYILKLSKPKDDEEIEKVLAKLVLTDENGKEMDKKQAQPYILNLTDAAALQAKVSCITQKYETPEARKQAFLETYRNNLLAMLAALKEGEKSAEALQTAERVRIKASTTVLPCADATGKSSAKLTALKEKFPNNKVVQKLFKRCNALKNKFTKVYGKAYEVAHNVAKSLAQNQWQTASNLVGSLVFTCLTAATGAGWPVAIGYMAYSTVSSWVAPVLDKASNIRKKSPNKMGFWAAIKKASQELKQDRKYKNKGWIGTSVNILGGGLIAVSGPANVVAASMVAKFARLVGTNTANVVEVVCCERDLERATTAEDIETAKTNLRRAETRLGIGLVASALTQLLPTITKGLENAGQEAVVDTDIPDVDMGAQDWASEYSPDMGIRKGQWELLNRLYSKEDLDRMSQNLTGNKGLLDALGVETKEEALFKYQRLSAWTDVVDAKTGLSIPGATRHFFNDEMADLNKILHCGDVGNFSKEEIGAIKDMFDKVRPDGSVEGIVGSSSARMVDGAITNTDCPQAQDRFEFGPTTRVTQENIAPKFEPEPRIVPEPENVAPQDKTAPTVDTVNVRETAGVNYPKATSTGKLPAGAKLVGQVTVTQTSGR